MLLLLMAPACLADGLADMKAVLKAYVEGRYHWSNVEVRGLVIDKKDLAGGLPEGISLVKEPPGKTVFKLDFAGGREVTATALVSGYVTVVKSRRLLRANSVIGPEDVSSSLLEVSRLPNGGFFTEESQVAGKRLTRSIGAGVTILNAMVSGYPLVGRGHMVTIVVETPGFKITTAGELVESARVGSNVKVMNISSRKMLSGLLADENTVLLQDNPAQDGSQAPR